MQNNIIKPLCRGTILHGKTYNYVIEKALGQGSFGITYLAKIQLRGALGEIDSDMKVAVKEFFMKEVNGREGSIVTASADSGIYKDYKKKFREEAEHLAVLKHNNIIKVLESFEENNTIYYTMEYIDGGSLDDYLYAVGPLPELTVHDYINQISDALMFMHEHKMLHLDLKPANIMHRVDGTLVLIDFGLSKQFDENGEPESSTSIGGGTPGYSPIEQATYKRCDGFPAAMDVYALGATAFKMLTGKRPPEAVYILNDGFPYDMLEALKLTSNIKNIIAKAMSPLKKDRFQSVEEFRDAMGKMFSSHKEQPTPKLQPKHDFTNPEIDIRYDTSVVAISYFSTFMAGSYMARVNRYCCDTNVTQESTKPYYPIDENKFYEFLDVLRSLNLKRKAKPDWYHRMEYSETPDTLRIELYDKDVLRYDNLEIAALGQNQWGNIEGDFFQIHDKITNALPGMKEYLKSCYYEFPEVIRARTIGFNEGEYGKVMRRTTDDVTVLKKKKTAIVNDPEPHKQQNKSRWKRFVSAIKGQTDV